MPLKFNMKSNDTLARLSAKYAWHDLRGLDQSRRTGTVQLRVASDADDDGVVPRPSMLCHMS